MAGWLAGTGLVKPAKATAAPECSWIDTYKQVVTAIKKMMVVMVMHSKLVRQACAYECVDGAGRHIDREVLRLHCAERAVLRHCRRRVARWQR